MNKPTKINKRTLWEKLITLQTELEREYKQALSKKNNNALLPMSTTLNRVHWIASFLGLTNLADVAAGGASFIEKTQESPSKWSLEFLYIIQKILDRTKDFISAKQESPSDDVFIDNHKSVLQEPDLKKDIQVEDLLEIFHKRQIDTESVSACRHLSVSDSKLFSHEINIPSSAKRRHRSDRTLALVYMDLTKQNQNLSTLLELMQEAKKNMEILLHGPLAIPWKKYQNYGNQHPYCLLIDVEENVQDWLKEKLLTGSVINILQKPETKQSSDGGKEEKPNNQKIIPRTIGHGYSAGRQKASNSISFDIEGVMDLEPLDKPQSYPNYKRRRRIRNKDLQIRFPVGAKLILIVSSIIIVGMLSLSFISLYFFREEISNRIEDTNIALSNLVARQAEEELVTLFESANLLFQVGSAIEDDIEATNLVDDFFANSKSLIYVGIPGTGLSFSNRDWFRENHIIDEEDILQNIINVRDVAITRTRNGETQIINISPLIPNLESPVIGLLAPFLLGNQQEALFVLADVSNSLAESVRVDEGDTTTVIVNSDGEVLAHPDYSRIFGGENLKGTPVFEGMYTQGTSRGLLRFTEDKGDGPIKSVGSFTLIPVGNLGVVSTVLERDAFYAVNRIQILNLTLLGSILSLTILGVYFFSQSISIPLKELALGTRQIKAKNYAVSLKPKTSDEVGQLTRHFLSMIPELEKVDRLQVKTSKFINPEVVRMIADDSLPEKAQTKDITVFFSDIRSFTKISEQMGDPQLVLDNLSEYFRTVVPCIQETQGVIDKFIGDAIMAVWGSMKDVENNADSAIQAALQIRKVLIVFNSQRGSSIRPAFITGCGLSSGDATVGVMGGGTAKEEWAHMGDTINLASRIEALNKPMGTDILISESTAKRVQGIYDLILMDKVKVKGKATIQKVYAVLGRLDDDTRPRTLDELRALVGIKEYSKTSVRAEDYEEKYEIIDS